MDRADISGTRPAPEPVIRAATRSDVPAIVSLLADDPLGATRERPGDPAYLAAFDSLAVDPRQLLVVASVGSDVVGTLQLTFIPGLSRVGGTRAQIEAVRVRADWRGGGVGRLLIGWAVGVARERAAVMVQLTTDVSRVDAQRFYVGLGFVASHVGMKLAL